MEIEVKKKNENELVFTISGADLSFVNAIRRVCMMEVPKLAIDDVHIIKNDSAMFDEVLAHRLGLTPLVSDSESIEGLVLPEECDCEDYCPRCSVSLVLKKEGPGVVYSKDLSSEDSRIKPVYDTIPLLKLKDGFDDNRFIFRIETDGSTPPEEVLIKACDVLSEKADKIIDIL